MTIFFSNPTLAPMREHLSYKNVDKMRTLLIELTYDNVTWWTRSLSIRSVTTDVAPKEYLMYYLVIIPAIRFLIGHRPFAPYLAYAPVRRYSTDNPEKPQLDNEDEQIYGEMHTADWWWTTQQSLIDSGIHNTTIILVLFATDKTVLTEHVGNMAQWPVYLTIGNLSHEIRRSRSRPGGMMVGLISIHKGDFLEVKMEIYHQTMGMITKGVFQFLLSWIVV